MKDLFIVRATNPENTTWVITVGDKLATSKQYESKEEAESEIDAVNWDLVSTMAKIIYDVCKSMENEKVEQETVETKATTKEQ